MRRAGDDDASGLGRWRWRVEENGVSVGVGREVFVDLFARWVLDHRATHLAFVAEVDGALAGMAWLMLAERVPAPGLTGRRFGDVQSVYVVPGHRDAGVGARLMAAVLAEARDRGLEFVTVHSSERAVTMYRRAGFGHNSRWLEVRTP